MNMSTATKYTKRDSATAALRKLGIARADYDDFIVQRDGSFYCDIAGAAKHAGNQKSPAPAAVKVAKVATVKVAASNSQAAKVSGAETVSTVCRALIKAGKTNAEIWVVVQPQFSLDAKKRGYPAWYRSEMRHTHSSLL